MSRGRAKEACRIGDTTAPLGNDEYVGSSVFRYGNSAGRKVEKVLDETSRGQSALSSRRRFCGERHRRPREAPFPEPPAVTLGSGHIVWLRPSAPVGDSGMPR